MHKERKTAQQPSAAAGASGDTANTPAGPADATVASHAPALNAQAEPAAVAEPPKACHGLGFEVTDKEHNWEALFKAYLYFVEGAPKASSKFSVERVGGSYRARARDCNGTGLKWQHQVQCCTYCHQVRTDSNNVAKNALLAMDKLLHAVELLSQRSLSKSELSYLGLVLERPAANGNEAQMRLKDAAKVRIQMETAAQKLPPELQGTSGESLFSLVLEIYSKGKGGEMENSVVHHMMLSLLQRLAGKPHPHTSAKLFALARVMRHLHKPTYEFFRLNALVGPHVDTIQKLEAK